MRSGVCETGQCPSVRLSVPSFARCTHDAAGLLLSAVPAGDRSTAAAAGRQACSSGAAARRSAANAGSVTLTADCNTALSYSYGGNLFVDGCYACVQ